MDKDTSYLGLLVDFRWMEATYEIQPDHSIVRIGLYQQIL